MGHTLMALERDLAIEDGHYVAFFHRLRYFNAMLDELGYAILGGGQGDDPSIEVAERGGEWIFDGRPADLLAGTR